MRNYVKRGSVSSRINYAKLRENVWNEVYSLDKEGVVLHDKDIQNIAMVKAKELNLHEFMVYNIKHNLPFYCEIQCFSFVFSQASDGWLYYFKKKFSIVDRHIDKVSVTKPVDDDNELDHLVDKFGKEEIPIIRQFSKKRYFFLLTKLCC